MRKFALLLLITLLFSGCHHSPGSSVKGSGMRVREMREVAPFTSITTNGAFTIEVTCQKDQSLEVEGDDNILNLVTSDVSNGVLRLGNKGNYSSGESVKFKISVPNLEAISANGAGRIEMKDINNEKFEIQSEGAPTIIVNGSTGLLDIRTNGAGKIESYDLRATRAVVKSNGATRVELNVAEKLDVHLNGPSSVIYKGDPVVNKSVDGPGKVERRAGEGA